MSALAVVHVQMQFQAQIKVQVQKKKKTSTSTANRHRYSYSHMYRYRYRRKQRRTCRAAHSGQVEALNVLPHLEPVHNLHRKVRHSHSRFFRRIQSHPTDRQTERDRDIPLRRGREWG
jgi:hypothetical protein